MYLEDLNSADTTRVISGFEGMKQLSDQDYLPAMREVARTYVWAKKDSVSLHRKRMLGYEYSEDGLLKGKDSLLKEEAIFLLRQIIKNDSTDGQSMAWLAQYYLNEGGGLQVNVPFAKELLYKSRNIAEMNGDTTIVRKVDTMLKQIKERENNK